MKYYNYFIKKQTLKVPTYLNKTKNIDRPVFRNSVHYTKHLPIQLPFCIYKNTSSLSSYCGNRI